MGRAPCCDKANVKKGPWSPEEDAKLKEYIDKFGTGGNWIALPQKAGLKRCGKSCRLRWLNYLRPNIKHGEFSDEEDRIICSLYASIGSRWSIIAAQLPGRTDNDIKNYWNTKLKKKLMGSINNTSSSSSPTSNNNINHTNSLHYNQLPMISPISSPPPYQCTSTTYYNSPPSNNSTMTMSFYNSFVTSPSTNNLTMQRKDNSTLLKFGGDQLSCSTSSDGSCSVNQAVIKCEDHHIGFYNNGVHQHEEDQKPSVSGGNNNNAGLWGQNGQSSSLLDYGLEEIKQLISTNNNISIGNSFNYFDGTKVEDNTKAAMYY